MSLMNVSQAWRYCYVWVGARLTNLSFLHCRIICSTGNTNILFPPSVSCDQTRIASQSVRQDMIEMLRAIFFTISMRSSSQQKGFMPRKQWTGRLASGQGERDMIGVLISESCDKTKCHLKFYLSSLSLSIPDSWFFYSIKAWST